MLMQNNFSISIPGVGGHQKSGVSHLMMSKFIANYDGLHFVAAVGMRQLAEYARKTPALSEKSQSFLGLSEIVVMMSKEDIWNIGGFTVTLQPGQVLEIPAGFVASLHFGLLLFLLQLNS